MKNLNKGIKGITLIALVITIIVLLILAGISISMISSQDGILGKAVKAKQQSKNAIIRDQIALIVNEFQIEKYEGKKTTLSEQEIITKLEENGVVHEGELEYKEEGVIGYKDSKLTDRFIIPEGLWDNSQESDFIYDENNSKVIVGYKGNKTDLIIPSGVTEIGENAFSNEGDTNRNTFTSIKLPSTVTKIGDNAFRRNGYVQSIEIPDSVTSIGGFAFVDCQKLKEVILSANIDIIAEQLFLGCADLKTIKIPDNVKTIGDGAFSSSGIENIEIPKGVEEIGEWSFDECRSLKNMTIKAGSSLNTSSPNYPWGADESKITFE